MSADFCDRRHLDFVLDEVLGVEALCRLPRFAGHGRDSFAAMLDTATAIAADQFQPHNALSDRNPPRLVDGKVQLIPEIGAALRHFVEAGFMAAHRDEAEGGLQLPWTVTQACFAIFQAANLATSAYPFLTIANANLLAEFASPEQRRRYAEPLFAGRFFGTMCLSEPQAGSSLGDLTTAAEPVGDGTYRIRGSKMWISAGDHEFAENIVHLVLARVKGAPPGVKGLSLFIVPKRRLLPDGGLGARNDVTVVGLNHKMGYRGTVNTALAFGEAGDCIGELVGQEGQGLRYMFHMMNEARIGVGLGATMLGVAGYRFSLDYARTRVQGRPLAGKDPSAPPVAIVHHPDIRRLLLAQKAAAEGSLCLCLEAARLVDLSKASPDAAEREEALLLLDVLTPMVKSWPSEYCLEANKHAIQILGGYGYTSDFPVEQLYRDNRLNPIHEGTHGIQALDLLGRKVAMAQGAGFALLCRRIEATLAEAADIAELDGTATPLRGALAAARRATERLAEARRQGLEEKALANAGIYLDMLGHVVIGWCWLRQALAAQRALARPSPGASADGDFYRGILAAARYFAAFELGRVGHWAALLERLETAVLETRPEWL